MIVEDWGRYPEEYLYSLSEPWVRDKSVQSDKEE